MTVPFSLNFLFFFLSPFFVFGCAGDIIIKEGTIGSKMYFIQEGIVDIVMANGEVRNLLLLSLNCQPFSHLKCKFDLLKWRQIYFEIPKGVSKD